MNLSAPQDCHFHGFLEKVSFTVVEIYRKIDKLIRGFLFSQTINLLLNTDKMYITYFGPKMQCHSKKEFSSLLQIISPR